MLRWRSGLHLAFRSIVRALFAGVPVLCRAGWLTTRRTLVALAVIVMVLSGSGDMFIDDRGPPDSVCCGGRHSGW